MLQQSNRPHFKGIQAITCNLGKVNLKILVKATQQMSWTIGNGKKSHRKGDVGKDVWSSSYPNSCSSRVPRTMSRQLLESFITVYQCIIAVISCIYLFDNIVQTLHERRTAHEQSNLSTLVVFFSCIQGIAMLKYVAFAFCTECCSDLCNFSLSKKFVKTPCKNDLQFGDWPLLSSCSSLYSILFHLSTVKIYEYFIYFKT